MSSNKTPLIWMDLETGGLDPATHAVLEVAMLATVGGSQRTLTVLVREPGLEMGGNVTEEAVAVNGLTITRLLTEGRSVLEVAQRIQNFIDDLNRELRRDQGSVVRIGGKNPWFDFAFLQRLFRLAGMKLPKIAHRFLDVSSVVTFLKDTGNLPAEMRESLGPVAEHFGLDTTAAHTGLGDCFLARDVYARLMQLVAVAKGPQL